MKAIVVTGGGRGGSLHRRMSPRRPWRFVVIVELETTATGWVDYHVASDRVRAGDAAEVSVASRPADIGESAGILSGEVNNVPSHTPLPRQRWKDSPRAAAVDYGPRGIRVNAVSLGSVVTERLDQYLMLSGIEK